MFKIPLFGLSSVFYTSCTKKEPYLFIGKTHKFKNCLNLMTLFKYLCSLVNPLTLMGFQPYNFSSALVSNYRLPKFLRLMCVTCRNFYSRPQIRNDLTCSFIILEYFIFIVTSTRCICVDTIIISAFTTKFFRNFFIW